jgi:hypothetical protein
LSTEIYEYPTSTPQALKYPKTTQIKLDFTRMEEKKMPEFNPRNSLSLGGGCEKQHGSFGNPSLPVLRPSRNGKVRLNTLNLTYKQIGLKYYADKICTWPAENPLSLGHFKPFFTPRIQNLNTLLLQRPACFQSWHFPNFIQSILP